MKNISKFIALICFISYANNSYAQEESTQKYDRKFKYGIGVNVGYPFNDPYNFNLGGDVRVQYNISKTYSLSFTTGYNNLFIEDAKDFSYVPIKVGYKSFLFSNGFYAMGEIGAALSVSEEFKENSMLFATSIGYATKYVDISMRYEFLKDFPAIRDNVEDKGLGQLMMRFAYGFDL